MHTCISDVPDINDNDDNDGFIRLGNLIQILLYSESCINRIHCKLYCDE